MKAQGKIAMPTDSEDSEEWQTVIARCIILKVFEVFALNASIRNADHKKERVDGNYITGFRLIILNIHNKNHSNVFKMPALHSLCFHRGFTSFSLK